MAFGNDLDHNQKLFVKYQTKKHMGQ